MNSEKSQGWAAFEWKAHLTVNLKSDIISLPPISALLVLPDGGREDNYIAYAKSGLLEKQLKKRWVMPTVLPG